MRMSYDEKSHGLFIRFTDGQSHDSEEVSPGVVVDYDRDGRPVGLELEDVRGFIDEMSIRRLVEPQISDGTDLRNFRERVGLTQSALGHMLDIPSNTIARWERGELAIEKTRLLSLALLAILKGSTPAAPTVVAPRGSAESATGAEERHSHRRKSSVNRGCR